MRRLGSACAILAGVGGLALLAGCGAGAPAAGRPVVITQVPAGTVPAGTAALAVEPGDRYPDGSRLVLADLDRPEAEPRVLSAGMAAAGGASVSIDGRRLVFVAKELEDDPFAVWTVARDGKDRRKVVDPGMDCGAAAFLPDGRIVFSARVDGPAPAGLSSPWALFVAAEDDGEPQRISFGTSELDPAVLGDGRVVYAEWQPGGDGRPAAGSFSLFTVHPDGTGAAPLHGHHEGPRLKLLPRQAAGGDVFFVAAMRGAPATIRAADWRSPARDGFAVALAEGEPLAVEPTAGGELLVAARDAGLVLAGRDGQVLRRIPAGGPGWQAVHAVEAVPRPRPQGHLSMVDPAGHQGQLMCVDARPPGLPQAARVRLRTAGPGAGVLGELPLAEDGSFFATVPANVPLLLDLLDAQGRTLKETETPVWVRPKETRGCIGCHEDPATAPPNRRPLAVLNDPVDLTGEVAG